MAHAPFVQKLPRTVSRSDGVETAADGDLDLLMRAVGVGYLIQESIAPALSAASPRRIRRAFDDGSWPRRYLRDLAMHGYADSDGNLTGAGVSYFRRVGRKRSGPGDDLPEE